MNLRAITIGLAALTTTGCTAGMYKAHSFKAPNGAQCAYHNYTANLYGPGLRRSDLLCDKDPGLIGLAHASGPDAGIALGTAGLQGAGIAGGAAILGVSYPANKRTSVQATGGSSSGATSGVTTNVNQDVDNIAATDVFTTNIGTFNESGRP